MRQPNRFASSGGKAYHAPLGLIPKPPAPRVDSLLTSDSLKTAGLIWNEAKNEFRTSSGIAVLFLYPGERTGNGAEVKLPEPEGEFSVEMIEGLPTLKLSKLIETKIACGTGNPRRTHKDLADVVELIIIRQLESSFVRFLHKSVRKTFRELLRNARGLN